jgi:peptidoglycan/xylan/chitin deacetylase (PgdA/CDA1 family)
MAGAAFTLAVPVDGEASILAGSRRYAQHAGPMSQQVYEIQRAVPRLLAMLAELDIRATFFVPGWTLERYPCLAEDILGAGHEMAHHSYGHRSPTLMDASEERADFERALAAMQRLGIAPAGHRAATSFATLNTLRLVAEYGLSYDCSLMGDDRPYLIETGAGTIVEVPLHWALDDFDAYGFLPEPFIGRRVEAPQVAVEVWREEFQALRASGGLCLLTAHAFLSGRPGRALALRDFLGEVREAGDVEFLTCREAAARAISDTEGKAE